METSWYTILCSKSKDNTTCSTQMFSSLENLHYPGFWTGVGWPTAGNRLQIRRGTARKRPGQTYRETESHSAGTEILSTNRIWSDQMIQYSPSHWRRTPRRRPRWRRYQLKDAVFFDPDADWSTAKSFLKEWVWVWPWERLMIFERAVTL